MALQSIEDVVRAGLCISCGACAAVSNGNIKMVEVNAAGMLYPIRESGRPRHKSNRAMELDVCPGKGYEVVNMGRALHVGARNSDVDFGLWRNHWAARALDQGLQSGASSGGIMTAIADHLLTTRVVSGVVVSRTTYGPQGPRAESFIAETRKDLISAQGSKYCPVPSLSIINDLYDFDGPVLFVGTPCQVAGLRLMQRSHGWLKEKVKGVVSNYCGGFRDFRETTAILRRSGFRPEAVNQFRYRGGGQPGFMRIEDRFGKQRFLPYPEYARMTGIVKNKRCRLCVDATGELADFSCGDAWVPRFLETKKSWSILMTRNKFADSVIENMAADKAIELRQIDLEEIRASQRDNLRSKKRRQHSRRRLYSYLGHELPRFDGGYAVGEENVSLEIRVLVKNLLFTILERLRLYPLVSKVIGRYPKF